MRKFAASVVFLLALFMLNAGERFEKQYGKELKVETFYPLGVHGFFQPGEDIRCVLVLANAADRALTADVQFAVKDYQGKTTVRRTLRRSLAAGGRERIEVEFPPPAAKGYFTVDAQVDADGRKMWKTQTGFIVITPAGRRDPFFAIDKNLITPKLLKGYELLGAGTLGIGINWYQPAWCSDLSYVDRALNGFFAPILNSDFKIMACFSPQVPHDKAAKERLKKELPVLTDADIGHVKKFTERFASLTKGRVRLWVIQQEFDADFRNKKMSGGGAATLANYVTMTRAIYRTLKRVNPDANIAVLGINGSDYFYGNPPFVLSRIVLDDLGECFDLLAIDAYSGNWNALRGPVDPPEKGLKRFLTDAAELSRSYQRPGMALNVERCYALDYFSAFDSDTARRIADYTIRSVIINRASPSPLYSLHVGAFYSLPHQIKKGVYDGTKPVMDLGAAWKVVFDEKGEETFIPRPAAVAFATAARELAFVSDPQEVLIGNEVYSYLFTRENGEQVIAVWCTEKPVGLRIVLPCRAVLTDMMGNRRNLEQGKANLKLTGSPQFLSLNCRRSNAAGMLARAEIPELELIRGYGRRISPDTAQIQILSLAPEVLRGRLKTADGKAVEVTLAPRKVTEVNMPVGTEERDSSAELTVSGGGKFRIPLDLSFLAAAKLNGTPVFDGSGGWFSTLKPVCLKSPDDIYPKSALVPELNLLQFDGRDISAALYFAWTPQYLCIAAKVNDRKHIQRRRAAEIWMEDAFQFVISPRHNARPKSLRSSSEKAAFSASEYNFGLALTDRGPELYRWSGGGKPAASCSWPVNVTRKGTVTLYEAAIPWKEVGIVPGEGLGIRFGAILMDNNRPEDRQAKYWLALNEGVAGTQDASQLKTLILKEAK